ncbi:MAG: L-fucose:H+ symporter permease [Cytophagales bacterium]|nr:L-fucose:H+ symporter permease [Cytophagales bacterium]
MALASIPTASASNFDGKNYTRILVIIFSLFTLWALAGKLNDILIPHLKKALTLTDFQSSLIQTAFFGGYFVAALPAGWLLRKIGYKNGIICALAVAAAGAALFYPAAETRYYGLFLFALFVMACGFATLEVAANPYVAVLGDPKSASFRLNLAQGFNSLAATVTPFFGAQLILSGIEKSDAELAMMSIAEMDAYKIFEADRVKLPYIFLAALFLFIALLVFLSKLPEIKDEEQTKEVDNTHKNKPIYKRTNLMLGVAGIFFYVGAQEGIAAFIIRFMQYLQIPGVTERSAANYIVAYWFTFMIGRFIGAWLLRYVNEYRLLAIFSGICVALALCACVFTGLPAVYCVVAIGFFNSIQFPTIFTIALKNLGADTKMGASLLVMAICGAAIMPAVMGYLSTIYNIQVAFIIPVICYLYVVFFSVYGKRLATT